MGESDRAVREQDSTLDDERVVSKKSISGALPAKFEDVEQLDDFLSEPGETLTRELNELDGDILVLGVGGKMGPTLARMARKAAPSKRIVGVARFSEKGVKERLEDWGIETRTANLLDADEIGALPKFKNVLFMAGMKFGAADNLPLTWAMNVHCTAMVASNFAQSRIVAFSTGNVYPLAELTRHGADENTPPQPMGEYAQSCLGRERMFEYFSARHDTPGRIFRLNYAIDLRYGVLFDLAQRIMNGEDVDISMGHVNVIWQGDANERALRLLSHCTQPTTPINVTGPETLSIRWLAHELGQRLGTAPKIVGTEAATALLSDTTRSNRLFGYPRVPLSAMLDWVADWVASGKGGFNKPTKYEVRDGKF